MTFRLKVTILQNSQDRNRLPSLVHWTRRHLCQTPLQKPASFSPQRPAPKRPRASVARLSKSTSSHAPQWFLAVQSIYRWLGQVESAAETLLILKTSSEQIPALESRLKELHSYDTPEFLVLPVESGSHPYLEWLQTSLKSR